MFASINRPGWRVGADDTQGEDGQVGIILVSGAIIISLLAMQARAPQWLLMFCGGWTLFTLVNVTWQPLMAFQLALIWGGYTFLSPKGLPQRKFWEPDLWEALLDQAAGIKPARVGDTEQRPASLQVAAYTQQNTSSAESSAPMGALERKRRLNKMLIAKIFVWILAANILIHLIPFNYSFDLSIDQFAKSIGNTLAIFVISLIGLTFRSNKTLGVAVIALLATPICILVARAHDPVAPRYFRELLYPNGMPLGTAQPDMLQATADDIGTNGGEAEHVYASDVELRNQQADRIAEMAASGSGYESATQIERDYLTLTPNQFRVKYGDEVASNLQADVSNADAARRGRIQDDQ